MKIVTLVENLVYQQGLVSEHGFSVYIETGNRKILFDTGQSGLFLQNAQTLGIDMEEVDALVLSHGHYDHTGGLYPFLKKNTKARVYAKKELFTPKYHGHNHFIGTPRNEILLKDRLVVVGAVTELAENVFIMPHIALYHSDDTHFKGFSKKVDNGFVADEFDDELFLAIRKDEQINILTACSHRGITNICTSATDHFKLPIGLILGGFHMMNCTAEQYAQTTNYFKSLQPKSIGVCHCTGVSQYANLKRDCQTDVFYNETGHKIIF